jgi:hypothetical protein
MLNCIGALLPITIESASLNPPYAQGPVDRQAQPLRDTGAATYWPQARFGSGPGGQLADLVLRPGQVIVVRLPVSSAGWIERHFFTLSRNRVNPSRGLRSRRRGMTDESGSG